MSAQTMQQLADKLAHVETEVNAIRRALTRLNRQTETATQAPGAQPVGTFTFVDKRILSDGFSRLFASLSIQGEPIGALVLQQKMKQEGLELDELSRSLIEAREE